MPTRRPKPAMNHGASNRHHPAEQTPPPADTGRARQQGHLKYTLGTNFHTDEHDLRDAWRRLVAEVLGTFLLTLVAAGAAVMGVASNHPLSLPVKVVAPALVVLALIYTLGDVSGAHLNPAVTLAFTLRRDFPLREVPGYWLAQLVGASLAALFLRMTFGNVAALGATLPDPKLGSVPAVITECVLTATLILVILSTAHHHRLVGHNAAFAVAATIASMGLFAAPVSGASMNPARSFGPDLIGGHMSTFWIYLVGPLVGALLASGIAWLLEGPTNRFAIRAARGA